MGEDPLVSGAAVDATGLGVHQLPNPDENTQTLFLSLVGMVSWLAIRTVESMVSH